MGQIVLYADSFSLTTTWTTYLHYDNASATYYPSYNERKVGNKIITFNTSCIPKNATITSASVQTGTILKTSSKSGVTATYNYRYFSGESVVVTDEKLLAKLTEGRSDTGYQDIDINFWMCAPQRYPSQDYMSPGSNSYWIKETYNGAYLVINYTFDDGTDEHSYSPATGINFTYQFSPKSILAGETTIGTYNFSGAGYYGLRINYRPEGHTNLANSQIITFTSSASSTITSSSISYSDYSSFSSRVTKLQVNFDFFTNSAQTSYTSSGWMDSGVYLLKSRKKPEITYTVSDRAGHFEKYGRPIQNLSELIYNFTFTLDPYSEAKLAQNSVTWEGTETSPVLNPFIIPITFDSSTTKNIIVKAKDSYGLENTINIKLNSYEYSVPIIDLFRISRYQIVDGIPVFVGAGINGALTLKSSTASIGGKNTYQVIFSNGISSSTIYNGIGALSLNETNNTSKLSTYTFDEDKNYNCFITVKDDLTEVTRFFTLRRAGATIMQVESYGIGIGRAPTGTITAPSFDCAFPAKMTKQTTFTNVNGINAINIDGKEYTIQLASEASAAEGFITITL